LVTGAMTTSPSPEAAPVQYKLANNTTCGVMFKVYYRVSCTNTSGAGDSGLIPVGPHEAGLFNLPTGKTSWKAEIYNFNGTLLRATWVCTGSGYTPSVGFGHCPNCNNSGVGFNNVAYQGNGLGSNRIDCAP
jgi:hypothetical protein